MRFLLLFSFLIFFSSLIPEVHAKLSNSKWWIVKLEKHSGIPASRQKKAKCDNCATPLPTSLAFITSGKKAAKISGHLSIYLFTSLGPPTQMHSHLLFSMHLVNWSYSRKHPIKYTSTVRFRVTVIADARVVEWHIGEDFNCGCGLSQCHHTTQTCRI